VYRSVRDAIRERIERELLPPFQATRRPCDGGGSASQMNWSASRF